jgi:hypothetical protein
VAVPTGWPEQVRPPGEPGWERTASSWLFDLCPPDYRAATVLKRHPLVLARFAQWHLDAAINGAATAVRNARGTLADDVPPGAVNAAVQVAHEEHDRLVRQRTQVDLVTAALQGRRFTDRL